MIWRPIEDCPKDGAIRRFRTRGEEYLGAWFDGAGWCAFDDGDEEGIIPADPEEYADVNH